MAHQIIHPRRKLLEETSLAGAFLVHVSVSVSLGPAEPPGLRDGGHHAVGNAHVFVSSDYRQTNGER